MLLFQCYLQCYFLCPGDVSLGCWDQTLGMNRAACAWDCSKKHLFSAGDLKKPLSLRTPWFACSSPPRPRNAAGSTSSCHKQPRTPGSSTGCPRCHFGLLPPRNTFQNTLICDGGCAYAVFYQESFCFSLFSAVLPAFLMPLPAWPGLNLAPDKHFSINQRFASVAGLFWGLIEFTISN